MLLDSLRIALAQSPPPSIQPPMGVGQHDVLLRILQDVLAAVDRHNPGAIVQTPGAHLELHDLLGITADTWRNQVARTLGADKTAAAKALLAGDAPNFLNILDLSDDENRHSAVIGWLLNPRCAPTIAPAALQRLVGGLDEPELWAAEIRSAIDTDSLSVHREYTIAYEWTDESRLDRIDLVVSGPQFVLAIENKVWAREHGEQTRIYWEWLSRLAIRHGGLFLSPSGFPAASENFRSLSYLELLSCLLEGLVRSTPTGEERLVLAGYVKTLAAGILRSELRATCQGGHAE